MSKWHLFTDKLFRDVATASLMQPSGADQVTENIGGTITLLKLDIGSGFSISRHRSISGSCSAAYGSLSSCFWCWTYIHNETGRNWFVIEPFIVAPGSS
jgi:hypothetical protein